MWAVHVWWPPWRQIKRCCPSRLGMIAKRVMGCAAIERVGISAHATRAERGTNAVIAIEASAGGCRGHARQRGHDWIYISYLYHLVAPRPWDWIPCQLVGRHVATCAARPLVIIVAPRATSGCARLVLRARCCLLGVLCSRCLAFLHEQRGAPEGGQRRIVRAPGEGGTGIGWRGAHRPDTADQAYRFQRFPLRGAGESQQAPSNVDLARSDPGRRPIAHQR